MATSNREILKFIGGRISHLLSPHSQSLDWFHNFAKLHDLYLYEFNSKKDDGRRASKGILDYFDTNSISIGSVLDLPCGIGRISQAFLEKGIKVTGVDISEPFLEEYGKLAAKMGRLSGLELVHASFKSFLPELRGKKYGLILNWWTSFGYSTYEDDVEFFRNLLSVAHENTLLIVETWHRDYILKHKISTAFKDLGEVAVVNENSFLDNCSTVYTTHKYYQKSGKDLIYRDQFDSSIRLYSRDELLDLFHESGWEMQDTFNSMEKREEFNTDKDRIVLILQPRK